MEQVYLATTNECKYESVKKVLSDFDIDVVHSDLDIPEPRSYDLQEIAKNKALFAYKQTKQPTIVIDSGFFVYSLKGFPKTFVNFTLDTIGLEGILKLADGEDRKCEFRKGLAFYNGVIPEPKYFESFAVGDLADSPRDGKGRSWSKLHSIFIPSGFDKTLNQLDDEEKSNLRKSDNFAVKFAEWYNAEGKFFKKVL